MILTGIHSERFSKSKYGNEIEIKPKISDIKLMKTSIKIAQTQKGMSESVGHEITPQFLSPPALTLEARILNNDFGIPPVDFHRPSLEKQFPLHLLEDPNINALKDSNEITCSEDRGLDAALKVRKGGCMQSRIRTADLKNKATCKCSKRRHHPHYFQPHQHCNDTTINNNIYYDKLPAYCTVLSRPPLGIMRNVRILPSELELQENEDKSLMFDKIPAYQSCFSNSTKYDKTFHFDPHNTDNTTLHSDDTKYCNCDKKNINEQINRGNNYGLRFRSRTRGCSRVNATNNNHSFTYNNNNNVYSNTINNDTTDIPNINFDPSNTSTNVCNDCGGCVKDDTPSSLTSTNRNIWGSNADTADDNSKQRRTLYMGRIPRGLSSMQLRKLFERFGRIAHCSVHFREMGDNYGFVTFARHGDAVRAIEKSREMHECRGWDVCFGGRRRFCEADYIDLDGSHQVREEYEVASKSGPSFNELLSQAFRHRS